MDFVKKNLIMIISAAVVVLSLVLIVLGMSSVSSVKEDMAATESQLSAVESLARGVPVPDPKGGSVNLIPTAKNVKAIKDVAAQAKAQGYKLLEVGLKENVGFDQKTGKIKRMPFLDGIFPKPVNDAQPYRFRPTYKETLDQILKTMDAGTVPSSEDLETSEEELAQEMGFLMDEILSPDSTGAKAAKRNSRKSNTSNEEELKKMAIKMAADKRASAIKVYCGTNELDVIASCLTASGTAPAIEEMWWAQLSVWLQQDFAAAIAETNASAKNVTESVVKRILSIQMMHGYILPDGFVGRQENTTLPESFVGLESNDHYDMLHFGITLVVDARRIPEFIDAMYKQNHYVLYSWKIEELDASSSDRRSSSNQVNPEELYRYGTAPVVKLTTYWEGYLLRDFYHWGIVGYDLNKETGKPVLVMYNGERKDVDDIANRDNLAGLMPKAIREALTDDSEDGSGGDQGD
jgi:hypothetical protein